MGNAGCIPPAPGYLARAARDHAARRRFADRRRGDDWLPCRAGRRARALRPRCRSRHAGQNCRRRLARRRLRREAQIHGSARAAWARLSGRHAQRQSAGHGCGDCDAQLSAGARGEVYPRLEFNSARPSPKASPPKLRRPAFRSRSIAWAPCGRGFSERVRSRTTTRRPSPTRPPSAASIARCWSRASGCRLRNSKLLFLGATHGDAEVQATIEAARVAFAAAQLQR